MCAGGVLNGPGALSAYQSITENRLQFGNNYEDCTTDVLSIALVSQEARSTVLSPAHQGPTFNPEELCYRFRQPFRSE